METLRREDDKRIGELETKVDRVADDVRSIRDMLISEPEASPLGRALLRASAENRRLIDEQRRDFEPVEVWWRQSQGLWKAILGIATVLGIVGSFFGIAAYFGPH